MKTNKMILTLLIAGISFGDNMQGDTSTQAKAKGEKLIEAAQKGDLASVQRLIKAGANVNQGVINPWDGNVGDTALMCAVKRAKVAKINEQYAPDESRYLKIVQTLINAGANVNQKDTEGNTAIKIAADYSLLKIVQTLINAGANVNAANNKGDTALMGAAGSNLTIIQALIKAGANVNQKNTEGWTALMCAMKNGVYCGNPFERVQALIKAGATINDADQTGFTVLMGAIVYNSKMVPLLIKAGANVNAVSKDGDTVLMWAVARATINNCEMVPLLIKAGANVNAASKNGDTVLMWAVKSAIINNCEMVSLLIKAGANVNAASKNSKTALKIANQQLKEEIKEYKKWLKEDYLPKEIKNSESEEFKYTINTYKKIIRLLIKAGAKA